MISNQDVVIKKYQFGNYTIQLQQINDVDKLIDEIGDEEFKIDERIPYWAEVWPSAIALSNYILNNQQIFKGQMVLELGCGIGLLGIAATIAGAEVLFSDYEEDAIKFTQRNFLLNFQREAETILLDWRKPELEKTFEIIIAADILYEERFIEPVVNTIRKLLKPDGRAFITEPNRTIAKPFFKLMQKGFELIDNRPINLKLNKSNPANLYIYRKC